MALPSRTLTARGLISYPDGGTQEITAVNIVKFDVKESAGGHLPLGGTSASTLELKLDNRNGGWNQGGSILGAHSLDGAIIGLELGVLHPDYNPEHLIVDGHKPIVSYTQFYDGGSPTQTFVNSLDGGYPLTFPSQFYWSNIGTFLAESTIGQEQETTITIKAADMLANRALGVFTDDLSYPKTIGEVLSHACSKADIALKSTVFLNSSISITKPVWDEDTTCRDVIGYIACVACGFARMNRDGLLEIVSFEATPDYSIGTDRYKTFTRQGAIFGPFNSLSVYEYGAPNGYGATRIAKDIDIEDNELNSIAVQGNPILEYTKSDTLMTNMLNHLKDMVFVGGSVNWQGDPSLTVGDTAKITDLKAADANVLVLEQTLSFDLGFSMSSGNALNSKVKGQSQASYMRVFTPTGKLNAAALDGDINIKAGQKLSLLAGADIDIKAGGAFTVASDNFKIDSAGNVTMQGKITSSSGNIGGFDLSAGKLEASPTGKPKLTLDTANSKIKLGDLILYYRGDDWYEINVAGKYFGITADNFSVGDDALENFSVSGYDAWVRGNVSALSFTDRTIGYQGNALDDVKKIKNDKKGNIDHATLPSVARKPIKDGDGRESDGRDLGAMVSLLTKAVQELTERLETLENKGVKK